LSTSFFSLFFLKKKKSSGRDTLGESAKKGRRKEEKGKNKSKFPTIACLSLIRQISINLKIVTAANTIAKDPPSLVAVEGVHRNRFRKVYSKEK